ncbi:hypothetical protein H3N56_03370 [Cetobacterium sp. 2A]|uniref:hypothetical protein n=1 Tax=Cetobacterium sp. 2A TaxID=2754723 RepID=UPI00163C78B2|nr:hypothetical protein [Cetobacterium sp. 2A]MBC2855535.1 hypothetical protein [Cetobacterium sp. 2A]
MKKLVLGIMILAGMTAFAAPGQGDSDSATINLTAYSAGELQVTTTTSEIDFGNLKAYNGGEKKASLMVRTSDFKGNQTASVKLKLSENTGLSLTKNIDTDADYNITVTPVVPELALVKGSAPTKIDIPVTLDKALANAAPAGQYTGSFTVTASYDI